MSKNIQILNGTDNGDQGQLLLSYPAIESYLLSCMKDDTVKMAFKLGQEAKVALTNELCSENDADKTDIHLKTVDFVFSEDTEEAEKRLIHSINEMDNGLETFGISSYDLDNLAQTLLDVYDYQQQKITRQMMCFRYFLLLVWHCLNQVLLPK